jgi:hypothetical protein
VCPHTLYACDSSAGYLLLHLCPHATGTAMHVSSYYSAARTLRTTATICVSSYYRHCYACVLILKRCTYFAYYCYYMCVLILQALLCMCPHTLYVCPHTLYVCPHTLYVCPHTTGTAMHVSSYYSAARTALLSTTLCVSSYYRHCYACALIRYMCVLIRYMCVLIRYMCVLILQALLCMCPHTTALHFLLHRSSYRAAATELQLQQSCNTFFFNRLLHLLLYFWLYSPHTELQQSCNRAATELQLIRSVLSSYRTATDCISSYRAATELQQSCNRAATHTFCTLLIQSCNRLQQSCNSYALYSPSY